MNAAKTVRTASAVERERAIDTIVLGFAADPFCRWLWPEPAQYLAAMARLVPIFGGKAFDEGTAYATEGFEATALWPAYLESSNPRNISLYLRHGFEIVGEIQHGSSPVMTPMLRPARAGD
ncbi:MAG: hypothetical protein LC634_03060 [Sphingomonadales bacterium]|nr:hypothetical protein [Sphingomonadales bacterium]